MNFNDGEHAILLRSTRADEIGLVVTILSEVRPGVLDVEASRGRFMVVPERSLFPLRAWKAPAGCRDELFDAHWIYADGGRPRLR